MMSLPKIDEEQALSFEAKAEMLSSTAALTMDDEEINAINPFEDLEDQALKIKNFLVWFCGFLPFVVLLLVGLGNIASIALSLIYLTSATLITTLAATFVFTTIIPATLSDAATSFFWGSLPFNVAGIILILVVTFASIPFPLFPLILFAITGLSLVAGIFYSYYHHQKIHFLHALENLATNLETKPEPENYYIARCENGFLKFYESNSTSFDEEFSEPLFKKTIVQIGTNKLTAFAPIKMKMFHSNFETEKIENTDSWFNYFIQIKEKLPKSPESDAYVQRFIPVRELLISQDKQDDEKEEKEEEIFLFNDQMLFKQGEKRQSQTSSAAVQYYHPANEDFKENSENDNLYLMRVVIVQSTANSIPMGIEEEFSDKFEIRYIKEKDATDAEFDEPRYRFNGYEFKQVSFRADNLITSNKIRYHIGHDLTTNEYQDYLTKTTPIEVAKTCQEKWKNLSPQKKYLKTLQEENTLHGHIEKAVHNIETMLKQLPDTPEWKAFKETINAIPKERFQYICPLSEMIPEYPVTWAEEGRSSIYSSPYLEVFFAESDQGKSIETIKSLQKQRKFIREFHIEKDNAMKNNILNYYLNLEKIAEQLRNLFIQGKKPNTIVINGTHGIEQIICEVPPDELAFYSPEPAAANLVDLTSLGHTFENSKAVPVPYSMQLRCGAFGPSIDAPHYYPYSESDISDDSGASHQSSKTSHF